MKPGDLVKRKDSNWGPECIGRTLQEKSGMYGLIVAKNVEDCFIVYWPKSGNSYSIGKICLEVVSEGR